MFSLSTVLFPLLMLSLLGGIHLYLGVRIHQGLKYFFPLLSRGWVISVVLIMALVLILGFVRSMLPVPAVIRRVLGVASSYWMGFFVYLLLYMLLADILRLLLCRIIPSVPLKSLLPLAATGIALATCVFGIVNANELCHVSYDVSPTSKASESETRLVMISDLHLGAVGSEKRLEKIVREINAQEPDIICIVGDFFDNDFHAIQEPERAAQILSGLKAAHGVYVCLGNHDSGQTVPEMLRFWEECKIRLLADAYTVIDNRLMLAGRLDPSPIGGFDGRKRGELESVLADAPQNLPVIVMDHNPSSAASYSGNVSLVLSGHTHKGQIFPGSLFTDRMFDVDHGIWQKDADSPHVIVSSGVGTWGMPMRVGTDSEIVTVHLRH